MLRPAGEFHPSLGRALGVAVLATALGTAGRALLTPWFGDDMPLALYIFSILASGWYGGFVSAILAVVLCTLAGDLLFMVPRFTLDVPQPKDHARMVIFVVTGVGFGAVAARGRRAFADALERRLADERFRLAARAARGILYDWDLATGHVYRSENTAALLGLASSPPATMEWWAQRMDPEDRARVLPAVEAAWAAGQSKFEAEYRVRHESGAWIYLWDQNYLLRDRSGRPVRVVGFTSDVTASRQAEEGLREADRRKDEFLAMLAHELRNPLAAATGAMGLLDLDPAGPRSGHARDVLRRQLDQLGRVLDDLLDVSRISRGKIRLESEPLDLSLVIRRAAAAAESAAEERDHELTLRLPPEPLGVRGDAVRLEQVFANLLGNAIKYSDRGAMIRVVAEARGTEVVVTVQDTGMGIAPEMLPRLFDTFSQSEQALDRAQGGLGLGLALSRGLAEIHGGTLTARSEGLGKGSEFELRLPALAEPLPAAPARPDLPRAAESRRVLLVEDNPDAAWAVRELLEFCGHDVTVSEDGLEGLKVALERTPEVVLLDLGLPGMDGFQVARELRKTEAGRGMVLVALSGYGQPHDQEKSRQAGFDLHLVKPVGLDRLLEALSPSPAETPAPPR